MEVGALACLGTSVRLGRWMGGGGARGGVLMPSAVAELLVGCVREVELCYC